MMIRLQCFISFQMSYAQLMKIILSPDIVIIAALCKVYESNEVIRSIVHLFSHERKELSLLNQLIYRELKVTKVETTLFRSDSPITKAMTSFLKMGATQYLHDIVDPLIKEIEADPNGFEVDPSQTKSDVKTNAEKLRSVSQKFFDSIIGSADLLPVNVRQVFGNLRKLVAGVFPESELKAIGGFLFLRFICPCVTAPEGFGLVKGAPRKEVRRALCLVGKVIQNTANLQPFKEAYMASFDLFVQQNKQKCNEFYERVSNPPAGPITSFLDSTNDEEEKKKDLAVVIKHLITNFAAVDAEYVKDPRLQSNPTKLEFNKKLMAELKKILGV